MNLEEWNSDPFYYSVTLLFFVAIGLIAGSFTTALCYRLENGVKILAFSGKNSRSFCPECHHTLTWYDLIPVFSWLMTKGKCRYCNKKISISYPFIEIASTIMIVTSFVLSGISAETIFIIFATPLIISMVIIDMKHMVLPNPTLLCFALFSLVYVVYNSLFVSDIFFLAERVTSGLVFGGLIWLIGMLTSKVLKKDALGFGDVILFAIAGMLLGFSSIQYLFILSGIFGVIFYFFISKSGQENKSFPFAPAILAAIYLLLIY